MVITAFFADFAIATPEYRTRYPRVDKETVVRVDILRYVHAVKSSDE